MPNTDKNSIEHRSVMDNEKNKYKKVNTKRKFENKNTKTELAQEEPIILGQDQTEK